MLPKDKNARSLPYPCLNDAVEEELECAMRLGPEDDLRANRHQPALADLGLGNADAPFEMLLPPGPAAPQRRLAVEPRHAPQAIPLGSLGQPERRAGREHHVHL